MLIKTLPVGHLDTNCYIVTNESTLECVVVDPGDECNTIMDYIEDNRLKCVAVMITHGHFDHVGAASEIVDETGAAVYMNTRDESKNSIPTHMPFDLPENGISYDDGDVIEAAGLSFKVIATPGHTPGGVSLVVENVIFSGDTLFRGSCGRTDLPYGDKDTELDSLKKLCELPGDYEVYPGHMESTTLQRERELNYYCRLAMQK